jgi:hypothetical protein
MQRPKYSL